MKRSRQVTLLLSASLALTGCDDKPPVPRMATGWGDDVTASPTPSTHYAGRGNGSVAGSSESGAVSRGGFGATGAGGAGGE